MSQTFPLNALMRANAMILSLERYSFECEAGPLANCEDWKTLHRAIAEIAAWAMGDVRNLATPLDEKEYSGPGMPPPFRPIAEPDLIARGMKWGDEDALIKDCVEQAGFVWVAAKPGLVNILHRVANAAHKAGFELAKERMRAAPIDMVLYCPACGMQHIDGPEPCTAETCESGCALSSDCLAWTNSPHRSHLCANCGHIWRPADVPTNGVLDVKTKGQNDSPIHNPAHLSTTIDELSDMLDDARAELKLLRDALGVEYEPHQSLFERTLQAAEGRKTQTFTEAEIKSAARKVGASERFLVALSEALTTANNGATVPPSQHN